MQQRHSSEGSLSEVKKRNKGHEANPRDKAREENRATGRTKKDVHSSRKLGSHLRSLSLPRSLARSCTVL